MLSALLQLRVIRVYKYWRLLATRASFLLKSYRSKPPERLCQGHPHQGVSYLLLKIRKHPDSVGEEYT